MFACFFFKVKPLGSHRINERLIRCEPKCTRTFAARKRAFAIDDAGFANKPEIYFAVLHRLFTGQSLKVAVGKARTILIFAVLSAAGKRKMDLVGCFFVAFFTPDIGFPRAGDDFLGNYHHIADHDDNK